MADTDRSALLHDVAHESSDPSVEDVAALILWFYALPGNVTGGSLHVALEDGNLEDETLTWCCGYAFAKGDDVGSTLSNIILRMSVVDRVRVLDLAFPRRQL